MSKLIEDQFKIENNVLVEYHQKDGVTEVVIPNDVTKIGASAFAHCENLTSITIPNSVIEIGNFAFVFCDSLKNIIIPKSVTKIGNYTFYTCYNLTSIIIPESVTTIHNLVFWNCENLKTINIYSYKIFSMLDNSSKALALNTIIRDKKQEEYTEEDISKFEEYIVENKKDIFEYILKNSNLMDLLDHMLKNDIYTKDELMDFIKELTEKYKDKTDITAILLEYSNKNIEEKEIESIIEDEFKL